MDFERFKRWVRGDVTPANPSDQAVARQAYADYLRAQIVGFAPANADALLERLTVGPSGETAPFPDLMGVETRLVDALNDDLIERTYWIVRERFNRVVGPTAIAEHLTWSPPSLAEAAKVSATAPPLAPPPLAPPPLDPGDAPVVVDAAALARDAAAREAALRHHHAAEIAGAETPAAPSAGQGGTASNLDTADTPAPAPDDAPPTDAAPPAAPPERP